MKKIQIIENRSEIGAGTRGASLGIDALKMASLATSRNYFSQYDSVIIPNSNDLLFNEEVTPRAKRITGIISVYEKLWNQLDLSFQENNFPLVLAADHASAGGTIAGIKKHFPNKRLGVIWIDAHGDLHSPFTSPTGNVHGMPLAASINENNQESAEHEVDQNTIELWDQLKNVGGIAPKINPDDIVFFGVRDTESPEDHLIEKYNIKNYTVKECRDRGLKNCTDEALQKLEACDILYISFDVDSMDSKEVSEGTGTPVENGYLPEEAEKIILNLLESEKTVCFEMVEINPLLDTENKMAKVAFSILENVSKHIEKYSLK